MPSPDREHPPAVVLPCGTSCLYAERSPATGGDWIWCHHPDAAVRLVHESRECRAFVASHTGLPAAGAADWPRRAE